MVDLTQMGAPSGGAGPIKDATTESFAADVLDASSAVPVIVDFWAPWCEPCKQLGPALERAVNAAAGKVQLVKINIDENQEIATQMRVQSIPAVYAFKDGRPIDGFVGALPESQIADFVRRVSGEAGPSPVEEALMQAAAALESGDASGASALYSQVLDAEPGNTPALAGVVRCLLAANQVEQARQMFDTIPTEQAEEPEAVAARSALELAEEGPAASGEVAPLMAKIEDNPNDHEARFELAMLLYAQGNEEAAIDELLALYRRDRNWKDEAARTQLLKYFEALGPTHALTVAGRRNLSSLMFA